MAIFSTPNEKGANWLLFRLACWCKTQLLFYGGFFFLTNGYNQRFAFYVVGQ